MPELLYGRDPRENPVVAAILDPDTDEIRYQAALAVASGRELAAAKRLLPLEVAAWRAAQDQRRARMAELRRLWPGIEDSV